MKNKKLKLLLTFLFLILSCSMVSASSDVDNLSADNTLVEDLSSNDLVENELAVYDENSSSSISNSSLLSADGSSSDEDVAHLVEGNQNGGVTSQGYTVFCADEDLSSPTKNTKLVLSNVSILTNSFYENSTGELLKILVYNYLDEIKDTHIDVYKLSGSTISYHNFTYSDLLMTCLVWSLTDSPYKNINVSGDLLPNGYQNIYSLLDYMYTSYKQIQNSLESYPNLVNSVYYKKIMDNKIDSKKDITDVLLDFTNRVVNDYENGVRIPDKAFKNYGNGTVRTYDFAAYKTVSYMQNLFAFKVTDSDIKNSESV